MNIDRGVYYNLCYEEWVNLEMQILGEVYSVYDISEIDDDLSTIEEAVDAYGLRSALEQAVENYGLKDILKIDEHIRAD